MKSKSLKELKEKANEILNNNKIAIYTDEEEIINKINEILNEDDENIDCELLNKTLDNIDIYMKIKEKMTLGEQDYTFLKNLSEDFKEQSIRKTDGVLYIPLFKIRSLDGEEKYFLTRKSAKEYIKMHKSWVMSDIIEIEESDNTDLTEVIEIIKRNF